jgi:arylsulfatase A-like enzyme
MRCLDDNPDFIFAVFPGVDSYSHLHHPRHEKTIAAYRFVDFSVGQVVEKLKRLERWEETLLIITSDHGLTATYRHLDLALFFQRRRLTTLYYPVIWKLKPKVSVMISGNAVGHVYCLDGKDGAPLLGAQVKAALGSTWDELLAREEIDFMAWRGAPDVYEIESAKGHALIIRKPEGLCYHTQRGDPFGLGGIATPLNRQQALAATFDSNYPDALVQIEQLFSSPRSGDLVVVSKNGHDLREAFEWPEHHASHGSLHREHMMVPLIYNQTGWDPRPARTVDLFNTILKWCEKPTQENTDGQPLC